MAANIDNLDVNVGGNVYNNLPPGEKPHRSPLTGNKNKYTEKDLLMMCVDNPRYISKVLGHDNVDGTGLDTLDQKKEMLKYFYKAWSGLVKFIYNQCLVKRKCVDFPLVGKFLSRSQVPIG